MFQFFILYHDFFNGVVDWIALIDGESLSESQAETSLDFLLNEADEALISEAAEEEEAGWWREK